jgi:nitroreductase
MMTSAAFIGIDSCPIEGFSYDKVREILWEEGALEDGKLDVSVAVTLGYRKEEPKRGHTPLAI